MIDGEGVTTTKETAVQAGRSGSGSPVRTSGDAVGGRG